jgi:Holliday junction DNA helicase RuvA
VIGSLRGTLLDRSLRGEVLVEVGGVGYRVTVTPSSALTLGELGGEVFVWVHHHVREDAQVLYGFATVDERACFEVLVATHGVGPALALAILSVHSPLALQQAVAHDDVAALCLVPGVGKKTAARLLIELKARLDVVDLDLPAVASASRGAAGPASPLADVRDALAELGYGPDEVRGALADLPVDGDAGLLLREALQRLAVRS